MTKPESVKEKYLRILWEDMEEWLKELPHTVEDKEKLKKLCDAYGRKRTAPAGNVHNLAASLLWTYAQINFLWDSEGKEWQQKNLAQLCGVSKSTMGQKAHALRKAMKIEVFDQRYARESINEMNPLNNFRVDPATGMIFSAGGPLAALVGVPLQKQKHDYYYDAMEYMPHDPDKAIRLLHKAREIDEHYVEAYVGLAEVYRYKGSKKKERDYAHKAFAETKRIFPSWPEQLSWGEIENRQYLRAIHHEASVHWADNDTSKARQLFELLLRLNPNDNQGIRYMLAGLYTALTETEMEQKWHEANANQTWDLMEEMLEQQNSQHHFWKEPVDEPLL